MCNSSTAKKADKEVDEMDQYNLESYDAEVEASNKSKRYLETFFIPNYIF